MTKIDPRHAQRIRIVQNLFASTYHGGKKNNLPFPNENKTALIVKNTKKIDSYIKLYAKRYPINKIAKTDLCILRLSVYELVIEHELPEKVVIDEAVELAKELSGAKSYGFVNAVLGKILASIRHETPQPAGK